MMPTTSGTRRTGLGLGHWRLRGLKLDPRCGARPLQFVQSSLGLIPGGSGVRGSRLEGATGSGDLRNVIKHAVKFKVRLESLENGET